MKFVCSIIILMSLITSGMCQDQCSASDIWIQQKQTGTLLVKGKPEFEVTLFNACPCPIGGFKLTCNGFQTTEEIDPKVLVVAGGQCYLPDGYFLAPFSGYVFTYAWDSEYQFKSAETNAANICVNV